MLDRPTDAYDIFLRALAKILTKAETHCETKDIKPEALLQFRLFPDMLPMVSHVQLTCDFAARAAARLAGDDPRSFADTETSFAELQARITTARDYIASFPDAAFDGWATRSITLAVAGRDMTFDGARFLLRFSLPQFHFHATTVYDILRHNGVDLGKRDYMG